MEGNDDGDEIWCDWKDCGHATGDWVRYEGDAATKAEIAALTADLRRITDRLAELNK